MTEGPFYVHAFSREIGIKNGPKHFMITASDSLIVDRWYEKMKAHGVERAYDGNRYTFGQDFIDFQNFVDYLASVDDGEINEEDLKEKSEKWYKKLYRKMRKEPKKEPEEVPGEVPEEAKQGVRDEVQEFKGQILLTALFTHPEDGDGFVRRPDLGFMRPWNPWTPFVSSV